MYFRCYYIINIDILQYVILDKLMCIINMFIVVLFVNIIYKINNYVDKFDLYTG